MLLRVERRRRRRDVVGGTIRSGLLLLLLQAIWESYWHVSWNTEVGYMKCCDGRYLLGVVVGRLVVCCWSVGEGWKKVWLVSIEIRRRSVVNAAQQLISSKVLNANTHNKQNFLQTSEQIVIQLVSIANFVLVVAHKSSVLVVATPMCVWNQSCSVAIDSQVSCWLMRIWFR